MPVEITTPADRQAVIERYEVARVVAHVASPGGGARATQPAFTTRTGHSIDAANLRRLVRAVADDAKVGKLSLYDLRHSAASILSELGVRNERLADLLGHVDTRMVERHYRHRLGPSVNVAVAPMGQLLA